MGLAWQVPLHLAAACAELVKSRAGKPNNGLVGVWNAPNTQGAYELGFRPALDLAAELKGKAVYVAAADPAGDDPALAEALKSAQFVVVQELFLTETAKLADVVLPASAYTEREGTYTSAERRVQRFYPAVPARPGTKARFCLDGGYRRLCRDRARRPLAAAGDEQDCRLGEGIRRHLLWQAGGSDRAVSDRRPRRFVLRRHDL